MIFTIDKKPWQIEMESTNLQKSQFAALLSYEVDHLNYI